MKVLRARNVGLLIVFALSVGLAASGIAGASPAASKKVCFLVDTTSSPYSSLLAPAMVKAGKPIGLNVQVLDGKKDIATQSQEMDECIAQKVAGIIVMPVDAKGIVPALAKAAHAGIPIVNSNAQVDKSGLQYIKAFTGPGDYQMALLAGTTLGKYLKGKPANIVEIQGSAGFGPTIARAAGFRAGLKAAHSSATVLASEDGNWSQQTAEDDARALIAKYGKKINYFYCHDDTMCVGAAAAIKSSGLPIKIVSLTLNKQGAALIKSGVFLFSVLQSPQIDGQLAAQTMAKILNGQSVPKMNYIRTPLVTKANLAKYPAPF